MIFLKKISLKNINFSRDIGLLFFIIVLGVIIQVKNNNFLTFENINDLLTNTAILSILAVGMMMVIITRGIDLSIGATLALSGMSVALLNSNNLNLPPSIAIMVGLAIGALCGLLVGLLIAKGEVLPIIATLGLMSVFRGLTFIISDGKWVSAHQMPDSFKAIATGNIFGINHLIFIAIIVNVFFYYILEHTTVGRRVYAVGSNPNSARISGINVDRTLLWVYIMMGALAGLAGVLWVSKFASAQGDTAMGYELNVIAACVLGGVSIAGGVGRISTLLMGTLLLGMLNNALPLMNVSPFWQSLIQGLIILFAVVVNVLVKRKIEFNYLKKRKI